MSDLHFKEALEGATTTEATALASILEVSVADSTSGLLQGSDVDRLWERLSYLGSNDIAFLLRGFEGVAYNEIVRDVCTKQKVPDVRTGTDVSDVAANEEALMRRMFADIWDRMSTEERRLLLESMNLDESSVRLGGAAVVGSIFAGSMGGFGTYQLAVIVANFVARALLGRGLTFAANAAVSRTVSGLLGPVGWIAGGAWLLYDLASPAFRKTVPTVIQIAALRQLTRQREIIGVMGHGSTGKDSLLEHVFGVVTSEIHPIPGATRAVKLYDGLSVRVPTRVMNFPGFGDLRPAVEQEIREQAPHCTAVIYLFNGAEIPKKEEIDEFKRYTDVNTRAGRLHVIPVLNKWDKADDDERDDILEETCRRLGRRDVVCASLKPKKGNQYFEPGVAEIRGRLDAWARERGREPMFGQTVRLLAG